MPTEFKPLSGGPFTMVVEDGHVDYFLFGDEYSFQVDDLRHFIEALNSVGTCLKCGCFSGAHTAGCDAGS